MQTYVIWFVAAFILVAAELMTGTLYLLVIGAGAGAGGAAAMAGAGFAAQLGIASVVSVAGIAVLRAMGVGGRRRGHKPSLSLDAGQAVEVLERRTDGSLRVSYRGTQWDAQIEGPDGPRLVIKATRGNTLIVVAHA
jgi:membrane protein implicated in regulation of membrane protease activity